MHIGNKLPFRIDSAWVGLIFFYFGFYYKQILMRIKDLNMVKLSVLAIVSFAVLVWTAHMNIDFSKPNDLSMNVIQFGDYPLLFVVSGIAGTILMFAISQMLSPLNNRWTIMISNGTIIVLAFQRVIMTQFSGVITSQDVGFAMLFSLAVLVVCSLIIYVCQRHFPSLLGYR